MNKKIAVIKGDGIGPEIITEAEKVLNKIGEKFGHTFEYTDVLMGGCVITSYSIHYTKLYDLDNLGLLAKALGEAGFGVLSLDLRNHGRSPHAAEHTYPAMVTDLLALLDEQGLAA